MPLEKNVRVTMTAKTTRDLGAEILDHANDCGLNLSFDTPMQMVIELVTDC